MAGMLDFLLPAQGGAAAAAPFDMTAMSPWLRPTAAPEWATVMPQPGEFPAMGPASAPVGAPLDLAAVAGQPGDALPPNATPASGPALAFGSLSGSTPTAPAAPQGSLLDRIGQGINDNSGMLLALGAGLAGAPTLGAGLSRGFQLAAAGGETDRKRRTENATAAFLQRKGYSPEEAAAIAQNPAVMQSVLGQMFGKATDDITEYKFAVQQGFKGSLADWMAQKRGGAGEYGLNPVWGTDANGKPVLLQIGKSGTAIQSKIPEGIQLNAGVEKVDLGTSWGVIDKRSGNMVGTIPKDVAGEKRQEQVGTAQGQAQVALPGVLAKAEQSMGLIDEMIAHPGRETATGLSGWIDPRNYVAGTDAADFRARQAQMQGRVFLEAYEGLRGGGAITDLEGRKAEAAISRLNTSQSDAAYLAALKELRGIIAAGMDRARQRAGQAPGAAAGGPAAAGAPAAGPAVPSAPAMAAPAAAPGLPPPPSGFNLIR